MHNKIVVDNMNAMNETLITAKDVSKKFCRDLKRSLWYGIKDMGSELLGSPYVGNRDYLRKEEFWALNGIGFEVKRGECLGLIGRNGAGKTTLLRLLNGLIKPDKGSIELRGRVAALIALGAGFNPILTGRENIYINAAVLGLSQKETDEKLNEIIEFAELEEFIDTPVQSYSSGMRVRLGFAIATVLEPDILILDEVLAVGDLAFRAKCYDVIDKRRENAAIIFVSHSMQDVGRICSKVLLLNKGSTIYYGENVSNGIDLYHKTCSRPEGFVIKTREGEFEKIEIVTREMKSMPTISYSDNLIIKIYARLDRQIDKPIFHVAILNLNLENICHSSSAYAHSLRNINGRVELQVTLKNLKLRAGIYFLDFSITDQDGIKIIARTHLSHQFQVTGTYFGYGIILEPGQWEIL